VIASARWVSEIILATAWVWETIAEGFNSEVLIQVYLAFDTCRHRSERQKVVRNEAFSFKRIISLFLSASDDFLYL